MLDFMHMPDAFTPTGEGGAARPFRFLYILLSPPT